MVAENDSLHSIAARINGRKASDQGFSVGNGASEYTLVLTGTDTGQTITFEEQDLNLGLATVEGQEPSKLCSR